jgi:hypothetical protein
MAEFSAWLDGAATRAFALSATLFVLLNATAVALVFAKRDRAMVNRWTARWVAANLVLIGAGVGLPVAAQVTRMTLAAISAVRGVELQADEAEPAPERPPQR